MLDKLQHGVARQVLIKNNLGSTLSLYRSGIKLLVICRSVRIWYQKRRHSLSHQLCQADCTGTEYCQIGRSQRYRHIMQIRLDNNVICHTAALFDFRHICVIIHVTGRMQHLYLGSAGKRQLCLQHSVVNGARTTAAAGNENRFLRRVQPQLLNSFLTRMLQNFTADRIAGIFQLCLAVKIFAALFIT